MPGSAMRSNVQGSAGPSASATGLTGLDQSGANFSATFWWNLPPLLADLGGGIWHHCTAATTRDGIGIRYNGLGKMRLSIMTAAGITNSTTAGPVVIPGWHHYGVVYNGATARWYRDGAVVESLALTAVPSAAGTRNTGLGGTSPFGQTSGAIFDLCVFPNKALDGAQVRRTMDPRLTVDGCKQRLFRDWTPTASGVVRDESGSGNNLTASATLNECQSWPPPPWQDFATQHRNVTGFRTSSNITGAGALTISSLVLAASGKEAFKATGAVNLVSLALASAGLEKFKAQGALALQALVLAAAGGTGVFGVGALNLVPLALTSAGKERIRATSTLNLVPLVIAAAGLERMRGTGSQTLVPMVVAAAGLERMRGSAGLNLVAAVLAANGNHAFGAYTRTLAWIIDRDQRDLRDVGTGSLFTRHLDTGSLT